MIQHAAGAASARQARAFPSIVLALALAFGCVAPALAGDRAQLDIIGYSEDNRYFAFEEYGVHDGSGFPYSSIYIVDLQKDSWTAGSPFSVVPKDEERSLASVRDEVRQQASAEIGKLGIDTPADIIALVGDGEAGASCTALEFGIPGYTFPGEVYETFKLELETFPASSPEPCRDYLGEDAKGYALTLSGDGEAREVHRDTKLPSSRGCPVDYRIYAVVAPFDRVARSDMVAFISAYPYGFEGPDRRFIALPIGR